MSLAVVIPSYNHAHYITKAIDSCLDQSRRPDRIVVIDDGSQDNSLEVLNAYAERGEIELSSQENAGAHHTINKAINSAATNCEWIAILNSDDFFHPARFERLLAYAESEPEKSVICSGLTIIDENNNPLDPSLPRAKWFRAVWSMDISGSDADLCEALGRANFIATTSNVIARADYLRANPFRPYRYNHDYFFLAKAAIEGQLGILPEPLVNYRVHSGNTITTAPAKLMREMLRQQLDLAKELASAIEDDQERRTRYFRYLEGLRENVSAFHTGLFDLLIAKILAEISDQKLEELAMSLDLEKFPELEKFPNGAALTHWHEGESFPPTASLAAKLADTKRERDRYKREALEWKALARERESQLKNRKLAWKRALGFGNKEAPR